MDSLSHEQAVSDKIENLGSYEREKIETTLKDAKNLVQHIEDYLTMVKYCDDHGITIADKVELSGVRIAGGPADPVGDILDLSVVFQRAKLALDRSLTPEQAKEIGL